MNLVGQRVVSAIRHIGGVKAFVVQVPLDHGFRHAMLEADRPWNAVLGRRFSAVGSATSGMTCAASSRRWRNLLGCDAVLTSQGKRSVDQRLDVMPARIGLGCDLECLPIVAETILRPGEGEG